MNRDRVNAACGRRCYRAGGRCETFFGICDEFTVMIYCDVYVYT